ncbi:DUF1539 domain-containing protein [Chlamydia psittaci]|uniref:DUF1539 domain-containing protein n=1 Tax=Chlamydophila parapsittaci TaxID=344886 RepID=A0ABX5VXL9_9CHLA|nr:DUF1539 domain-containing protein [Chlamydophila parapsittaci]QHE18666.1 DUF1539 domain-containing protein [Chlamydia psittaci]
MSKDILSLTPILSPFLTSLETASCEKISCNYKKLIRPIHNLHCWDSGWENIMNYLTIVLSEDPSHPDAETFPIMMHPPHSISRRSHDFCGKNSPLLMKFLRMQICADRLGVKQFAGLLIICTIQELLEETRYSCGCKCLKNTYSHNNNSLHMKRNGIKLMA